MRFAALILLALLPLTARSRDDLVVKAEFPHESTGTMHFAESLTLSIGTARALTLNGEFLPIPGPWFRLPDSRFFLLGWSSTGSGMQTLHALLLALEHGAVRQVSELEILTDRASAALLVRHGPNGSLALGLPPPSAEFVHNEEEWSLSLGGIEPALPIEQIRQLAYEAVTIRTDDVFYAPPAQLAPRPTRVAWIAITPDGFSLAPGSIPMRGAASAKPWQPSSRECRFKLRST